MRAAPPVQVACGSDGPWRRFGLGLQALAAGAVAAWLARHLDWAWPGVAMAAALAAGLAGLVANWATPTPLATSLQWDGQRWAWQGQPCDVSVMLDLDRWLLLRVTTAESRQWVPVSLATRQTMGALFRAALLAHAGRARHGDD
jgi:hypothetical protein